MTDEPVPGYAATRRSLHTVAEHVLAAALHRATGRIGLRPTPAGFGTPWFGARRLRVEGVELVVEDDGAVRRAPLRTVGEAAAFAGVVPGAPADVYAPVTPLEPDAPLALDPGAAVTVHEWFRCTGEALAAWGVEVADRAPTEAQLWPEHFDLALVAGEVNYGGSPGDDGHPAPYAFVGPWHGDGRTGDYWNEPFGASRSLHDLAGPEGIVAFFREASLE